MSVDFSSKTKRILYESIFCEQEKFDIIISDNNLFKHSEERIIFRIISHDFNLIETIFHSKRHLDSDKTICERSNVQNICSRVPITVKSQIKPLFKFVDSYRDYIDKTDQLINVIQTPDDREHFIACSFMKNIYVFGGFTD